VRALAWIGFEKAFMGDIARFGPKPRSQQTSS